MPSVAPFSELFGLTVQHFKTYLRPILTAAIAFGVVIGIMQAIFIQSLPVPGFSPFSPFGIDQSAMEDMAKRLEGGDTEALQDFVDGIAANVEKLDEDETMERMEAGMWNMFGVVRHATMISLLIGLVTMLSYNFFLVQAVTKKDDFVEVFQLLLNKILALIGLSIYVLLLSCIWIPFLGIFIAIAIGPRFALAGVILLTEGKGITASASLSWRRTQGYWGKIVGNAIVLCLCMFVATIVLAIGAKIIAGMLGFVPYLSELLHGAINQLMTGFGVIFSVYLAQTIIKHPLGVVKQPESAQ